MTKSSENINDFKLFSESVDYSYMENLKKDPESTDDGKDHQPRQVFSGHYVPVAPSPIENSHYITHSKTFFEELGISDDLAKDPSFQKVFSGDLSVVMPPMKKFGWATGYALSIYGNEYTSNCPFGTGNGYGDGRAISIYEGILKGKRWEMQLKGGGPTPYCRGGDGRAVLRSSVREFLAQEYMYALGIPTSRSLTLYGSKSEQVKRPWYSEGSQDFNPDVMVDNFVAISTRVAPSFLRVGQLELFARRVRQDAHSSADEELKMIVQHIIEREYQDEIDQTQSLEKQVLELAKQFSHRLAKLIANWIRVGYCQGNFNSDNCAIGGFTLDYGPFGFCEIFDPMFQPWTGGGQHFSFFNQPNAGAANFHSFYNALRTLIQKHPEELAELDQIQENFQHLMRTEYESMWAAKLGLNSFSLEIYQTLLKLMAETKVDYIIFFRELSHLPESVEDIKASFYKPLSAEQEKRWKEWLLSWREEALRDKDHQELSKAMKEINPKYGWREWLIVPAYEKASEGDYSLIQELQTVLNDPYGEQSKEIEEKYYRLKPEEFFKKGGVSHYSCSS